MEPLIEQTPNLYYECKPENVMLSPEHSHIITPDDNKKLIDEQQQIITDLREFTTKQNDVIKKLIEKQDSLEEVIKKQNELLTQITDRLKK
jgi:hypothetical protein